MTCRAVSCDCNLMTCYSTNANHRLFRLHQKRNLTKAVFEEHMRKVPIFCFYLPAFLFANFFSCGHISPSFLNGLVQRVELQNRGRVYTSHERFPQFPMKFHRCELQVVYDQLDQIDAEKRCLPIDGEQLMGDHRRVFTMGACTLWRQSGI